MSEKLNYPSFIEDFKEKNENSEVQHGNEYFIKIGDIVEKFEFSNPEEFLKFTDLLKKIFSIYVKNNEFGDKFYYSVTSNDRMTFIDLKLDNSYINDTTYLSYDNLFEIVGLQNKNNFLKLLNSLVDAGILKNVNMSTVLDKTKYELKKQYQEAIDKLYNKESMIIEKLLQKYSIVELYNYIQNGLNGDNLTTKLNKDTSKYNLDSSIIKSALFMRYFLKHGYKIHFPRELYNANDYNQVQEFNCLWNFFPPDVKFKLFNDKYSNKIRKLIFIKDGTIIKIQGLTVDGSKIDVGIIKVSEFYNSLL